MKRIVLVFLTLLTFYSCSSSKSGVDSHFSEEEQLILKFQDQRQGDSIVRFFKSPNELTRVRAALAYASIINLKYYPILKKGVVMDSSAKVKTACIYSIGQLRDSTIVSELISILGEVQKSGYSDSLFLQSLYGAIGKCGGKQELQFFQENFQLNYPYSLGMLRYAYQNRSYTPLHENCIKLMESKDERIRINAATILTRQQPNKDSLLEKLILNESSQLVKNILSVPLGRLYSDKFYEDLSIEEFLDSVRSLNNPYRLATLVARIVPESYEHLDTLLKLALTHEMAIFRTACANQLVTSLGTPRRISFNAKEMVFNDKPKSYYLTELLNSKDMALQSVATYGIKNETVVSLEEAKIVFMSRLKQLENSYDLPREKETYLDVKKTISYLNEVEYKEEKPDLSHLIDWEYINSTPENQKVLIQTEKGNITITCFTLESPGSVCNFLKMVDSGYYDNKPFHRVVPNFVIQTGCNRGDGWGAPNWTQRSEFSNYQSYTPGTVGLASAGKDTEGFQWFITHTYTPFLDGRYSIFARVTEGMDIVDKIEFGDNIISVTKIK